MDVRVFSLADLLAYHPERKTYLIRVQSAPQEQAHHSRLLAKRNYSCIREYSFDIPAKNSHSVEELESNVDLATRIVTDFAKRHADVQALAVHCTHGKNRSPAIALALSELFQLRYDPITFRAQHPHLNEMVYELILAAGEKMISDGGKKR